MNKSETLIKICICKHRSAKSLVYSWFCLPKETSPDKIVNLKQFTGKKENGSIKQAVDIILSKKFWGFYRRNDVSEIHLWCHKTCKVKDIMGLISHEVAHSAGYISENSAIKIASISQFALQIMLSSFKDKIYKKVK
jgi:hypothetical protein